MLKENALKRRCKRALYSIYNGYLEDKEKLIFDEIKEIDPYLNQIVDDVIDYVIYDLPLQPYILEAIRGEKHVGR